MGLWFRQSFFASYITQNIFPEQVFVKKTVEISSENSSCLVDDSKVHGVVAIGDREESRVEGPKRGSTHMNFITFALNALGKYTAFNSFKLYLPRQFLGHERGLKIE